MITIADYNLLTRVTSGTCSVVLIYAHQTADLKLLSVVVNIQSLFLTGTRIKHSITDHSQPRKSILKR